MIHPSTTNTSPKAAFMEVRATRQVIGAKDGKADTDIPQPLLAEAFCGVEPPAASRHVGKLRRIPPSPSGLDEYHFGCGPNDDD